MAYTKKYKLVVRDTGKVVYESFEWFNEYFTPEKFEKQENCKKFKVVWVD